MLKRLLIAGFILAITIFSYGPNQSVSGSPKKNIKADRQSSPSPRYVPVLLYHHLDPKISDFETAKPSDFEQQIAYLHKNGYHTITVPVLEHFLHTGIGLPSNPILITFDDGYESNYKYAYPILRKYHMKATIFVIVERMGKTVNGLSRLTWDECKEMSESGLIDIQSHSYNLHNMLRMNNKPTAATLVPIKKADGRLENKQEYLSRVKADFIKSKQLIELHLGKSVTSFCFPYGAYNNELLKLVQSSGFTTAFTTKVGVNTPQENPFEIPRIIVSGTYRGQNIENAIRLAKAKDQHLAALLSVNGQFKRTYFQNNRLDY